MWRTGIAVSISALLGGCGLGTPALITRDGALAPCEAPHCVSSLSEEPKYHIEPIRYSGSRDSARNALLRLIADLPGAAIVTQTPDYVHATFTSKMLEFVDDLELTFPQSAKQVEVRSASRVGYYDFDVNRKRVESLRGQFEALQP
jgi:uncharacterized protein (DUF1499 family)